MTPGAGGEVAFRSCWALVDELARLGLSHACLSPGSRSTPLALALGRHPGVRVYVHLDERASAYFALGIAKATGGPVALACTSGTAVANMLPAVVEADLSRTPLVLLTADRPPEMRGVGANQTIDQVGIFGGRVRAFEDAPVPEERPALEVWRGLAARAMAAATGRQPGPVHLNMPFREPLVPGGVEELPVSEPVPEVGGGASASAEGVDALAARLAEVERGVIMAGSVRLDQRLLPSLSEALGWPLLAEPTSGGRVPGALTAGQLLIDDEGFLTDHVPELILQVGAAPTSRAGLELVRRAGGLAIADPDDVVGDPHRRAEGRLVTEPDALMAGLGDGRRGEPDWLDDWREADAVVRATVDALLDGWDEPFEPRIARDLAAWLPDGTTLVVGSSLPVRDLDAFMAPRAGLRILANRGASGIDGLVSTALGVSASGTPTVALLGDLTLLHDVGSLLWSASRGSSATFVVPNNGGGAIFSLLPQRELPELDELFVTPHGLDLSSVCAAAGAGHTLVERAAALPPALEWARSAGGVNVVEVPVDRGSEPRRRAEVRAAVEAALSSRRVD